MFVKKTCGFDCFLYFCNAFDSKKAISKKSITICPLIEIRQIFKRRDEHLCFRLDVYAIAIAYLQA